MTQGLQGADVMLGRTGRRGGMSAIMVTSDGRLSITYPPAATARELKDEEPHIYLVAISEARASCSPTTRSLTGRTT